MLLAHPLPGGGWRAQRDGRGRLDGPLCGPGSEGSKDSDFCHPYQCVPPLEMTPPPSFRPERRNLTPKGGKPMVTGDLSTQRFNRDEYLSLITTGSPARDDDSGRQHTVIRRETNWPKRCPAPVISTEAEWSGEISLQSVTSSKVAGDLSALRFIRVQSLCPIPTRFSVRDDDVDGQHTVIPGDKLQKTMPRTTVISTEAKRSGEISRLYGTRLRVAGDLSTLRFIRAQSFCPHTGAFLRSR